MTVRLALVNIKSEISAETGRSPEAECGALEGFCRPRCLLRCYAQKPSFVFSFFSILFYPFLFSYFPFFRYLFTSFLYFSFLILAIFWTFPNYTKATLWAGKNQFCKLCLHCKQVRSSPGGLLVGSTGLFTFSVDTCACIRNVTV